MSNEFQILLNVTLITKYSLLFFERNVYLRVEKFVQHDVCSMIYMVCEIYGHCLNLILKDMLLYELFRLELTKTIPYNDVIIIGQINVDPLISSYV